LEEELITALPTPSHKATIEDIPDEAPENELPASPPPPPASVEHIAPAAPEGHGHRV
ncbi:hypothetical protein DXG01_006863, partial [Tephrocybe rancida]